MALFHLTVSRLVRAMGPLKPRYLLWVHVLLGGSYVLYLHGAAVGFMAVIAAVNFGIAKKIRGTAPVWIFNIGVIWAVQYFDGFRYREGTLEPERLSMYLQKLFGIFASF